MIFILEGNRCIKFCLSCQLGSALKKKKKKNYVCNVLLSIHTSWALLTGLLCSLVYPFLLILPLKCVARYYSSTEPDQTAPVNCNFFVCIFSWLIQLVHNLGQMCSMSYLISASRVFLLAAMAKILNSQRTEKKVASG